MGTVGVACAVLPFLRGESRDDFFVFHVIGDVGHLYFRVIDCVDNADSEVEIGAVYVQEGERNHGQGGKGHHLCLDFAVCADLIVAERRLFQFADVVVIRIVFSLGAFFKSVFADEICRLFCSHIVGGDDGVNGGKENVFEFCGL